MICSLHQLKSNWRSYSFSVFAEHIQQEELMGWHQSGVKKQNSSYLGTFQWNFYQGKGNFVRVSGNSNYPCSSSPSKNDWKVGWNPREAGRVSGELKLSEFELSGVYWLLFKTFQGSYSYDLFKFQDFQWLFAWPFPVFYDLRFSCHLQNVIPRLSRPRKWNS